MKAIFINGGPRKKWSTYQMLEKAMEGLETLRAKQRDEQFPKDLEKAYELGKRLVQKAKELN